MTVNDADFGKLAMSHSKGVKYSNYDDVIWCQAKANYSTLYYTDKTKLVVSKSLKNMELILPEKHFIRIHQSHIVNIGHVNRFIRNGRLATVELINGANLAVSRNRKKYVTDLLSKSAS
ncbi:MAG: LytTR family transcriptional regulator [Crocinitomicaceae bacterium]|nr:LytTR family transcriptional regulator [Crocinitomicaceae bacterium]